MLHASIGVFRADHLLYLAHTSSLEEAPAEVERAEEEYKQKTREFRNKNKLLLDEMATNPSKYVMRIHELEQQNAQLVSEVKELKLKAKRAIKREKEDKKMSDRLERGLEKLARRMDLLETSQGVDGVSNHDAREIYKHATGKDLGEEGFFGVEPSILHKTWIDPRIDKAESIKWNDPSISLDEALRQAGFDYSSIGRNGKDKHTFDSDGKSLAERKHHLRSRLKLKKNQLARKAASDPEAAREYAARYPPAALPPPYGGLPLDDIPDQPLVFSAASKSGYRGVRKVSDGSSKFSVYVGDGTNGGKIFVGSYETAEEAARIYAKAKYYTKEYGIPPELKKGAPDTANDDSDDNEDYHIGASENYHE